MNIKITADSTCDLSKELVEKYPEFKDMYQEIYDICENVEDPTRTDLKLPQRIFLTM